MMVKVVKLFTVFYEKDALINLYENTYAEVSCFIKFHACRLKKDSSLSFTSAKYPFFEPGKTFPSTLVILNAFETNPVNCLRNALSGGPRQTVGRDITDLLLIKRVICPKCGWKSEAAAKQSSVKMRFCKTSHIIRSLFSVKL